MEKLTIYSKGVNGSTTYSIFEGNNPVITNKELGEISKNFTRMYPEFSEKIQKHYQNFSDLPKEINLSKMEPGAKFMLIESISIEVSKKSNNLE